MSVVGIQDDIRALGIEIVWVLEAAVSGPGTTDACFDFMHTAGATQGWCVGDEITEPIAGAFDDSHFGISRGFDILVPRSTMEIVYTTNHGTGPAYDNPTASELLADLTAEMSAL